MMPAHIAHVDSAGCYTYSNRRLNAVIPGRPSHILGMHIREALGPSAHDRIAPHLAKAYAGRPSVFEFTDDDSARRIRAAFTPDQRGGAYILSMDVTEETQARVALQQTRKRELAAQMTSGLAHDFSNLLTIILGLQSKLARVPQIPPEATTLIDGTLAAARRGGTLLSSIASMTGKRSLRPRATDLPQLLRDLATLAAPTLPSGVTLEIINAAPDAPILLDTGMVQDSLLNLILNARDACGAQGQITLTVHVLHDIWIAFDVSDTGPGFSPSALDQAFDPFFTTKDVGKGSGLGLSVSHGIINQHGGRIEVKSEVGRGTTFRVFLPSQGR